MRLAPRGKRIAKVSNVKEVAPDSVGFNIGDQVKHTKWGVGTVMFKSGAGEDSKLIVVFPEEGQKKLAVRFANLKKVGSASKAGVKALAATIAPAPRAAPKKSIKQKEEVVAGNEDGVDADTAISEEEEEKALPKGRKPSTTNE